MLFTRLIVMEKRKRIVKKLSFEDLALLQMGKDLMGLKFGIDSGRIRRL